MRKGLLVILMLLATGVAYSQFSIGPKIGVNVAKLTTDFDEDFQNIQSSSKTGFQFGAFARIGGKVYLQPEILWSTKGGIVEFTQGALGISKYDTKLTAIDIPIFIGYKLIKLPIAGNIRVFGGPIASFVTSSSVKADGLELPSMEDYKSTIWSLGLGAGVDVLMITLDVRYEIGLSNVSDAALVTQKSNVFNVSLGWKIL